MLVLGVSPTGQMDRNWWRNHLLATDVHMCLKRQEEELRAVDLCNKFYAKQRTTLIHTILCTAKKLHLSNSSKHLAVYIMDCYANSVRHKSKHLLHLIAAVALRLAVKVEEDYRLPDINDLQSMYTEKTFTAKDFLNVEIKILRYLHWQLTIPTVPLFLDYYKSAIVNEVLLEDSKQQEHYSNTIDSISEMSLYDPHICRTKPSVLATSIVVASRCFCNQLPLYPSTLQTICQYPLQDILTYVENLLSIADRSPTQLQSRVACIPCEPAARHSHYDGNNNVGPEKPQKQLYTMKIKGKSVNVIVSTSARVAPYSK